MAKSLCAVAVAGVLLSGCSVRPLPGPESRDGLPVFDIVRRIQCEAATAVRAAYQRFVSLSKDVKALNKKISATQKYVADKQRELAQKSDFGTREEELQDAAAAAAARMHEDQIKHALARIKASNQQSEEKDLAKKALDREDYRVDQQIENISIAIKILREIKLTNANLEALRAERSGKRYRDIVEFEGHNAVFQFDFEITENNNLSSQGSVVWPILLGGLGGTFTMGYDVGDKRERLAKRTVKLAASFGELASSFEKRNDDDGDERNGGGKLYCGDVDMMAPDQFPRVYPMTGNIGLEGGREYLAMLKNGKFKSGGESIQTIQFTTTMNGSLKPGIDLARKEGPTARLRA